MTVRGVEQEGRKDEEEEEEEEEEGSKTAGPPRRASICILPCRPTRPRDIGLGPSGRNG
ncbi:hypothetical protein LX32DRAFT_644653 [Colletotrichum zoysiae]|uniref:Uncharacterized protein n=1 Tax=Colletotrichum zoysiae TaxID=1216348 RepID=A0AAD9LW44_9PEZI|nr:hypothetical protein LX32DRAFT_644653 [Colletotrichum zoysiae]